MAYQGYKNYATWGVALVFDNDEGLYRSFRAAREEFAEAAPNSEEVYKGIWTEEEFVKFSLADYMKEFVEEAAERATIKLGEGAQALVVSQLLAAATDEVDWHQIAEHFMEE